MKIKLSACIRNISIRNKIVFFAVLIVFLPMAFAGMYFNRGISQILKQNATSNLSQLIVQTNDNIESTFQILDNTPLHFLSGRSIRSWLNGDVSLKENNYESSINKAEMEEELKYSLMFNNAWEMNLISTAFVFYSETEYCYASRRLQNIQVMNGNNLKIYKRIANDKAGEKKIIPPSMEDRTIYFTRKIYNINKQDESLVLIYGTDEARIYDRYSALLEYPGSVACIIDGKGIVFSSSNRDDLGGTIDHSISKLKNQKQVSETELNGGKYLVAAKKIGETGLTFIIGIPTKNVLSKLSDSNRNYIVIITFIALASVFLSASLSLIFTRFIGELLENINKVKTGNYDAKMPVYRNPELGLLSDTFNNMTSEIKYLINQVYEKQLLLRETEYKFLQSQMNPHFLFNTLVTISYKARLSNDETLYKMVTSLSELLQASIYSNNMDKVTIRQELEYAEFYLFLQKVRFEDKLEYSIRYEDAGIMDYYVPKLCVEPIVENAVIHGLEKKMGKGKVDVSIIRGGNSIYFEISDDGAGFEAPDVNLDRNGSPAAKGDRHISIGLSNTHKRIKLMYGEQYGITIKSEANKGSLVTVHIPADKEGTLSV